MYQNTTKIALEDRGAKQGGGGWGVTNHLNFGWGVEHLSTPPPPPPPDFEEILFTGGWLHLN